MSKLKSHWLQLAIERILSRHSCWIYLKHIKMRYYKICIVSKSKFPKLQSLGKSAHVTPHWWCDGSIQNWESVTKCQFRFIGGEMLIASSVVWSTAAIGIYLTHVTKSGGKIAIYLCRRLHTGSSGDSNLSPLLCWPTAVLVIYFQCFAEGLWSISVCSERHNGDHNLFLPHTEKSGA